MDKDGLSMSINDNDKDFLSETDCKITVRKFGIIFINSNFT